MSDGYASLEDLGPVQAFVAATAEPRPVTCADDPADLPKGSNPGVVDAVAGAERVCAVSSEPFPDARLFVGLKDVGKGKWTVVGTATNAAPD